MFSCLFRKPKHQPITTIELKSTPLPTELQSLLQNKEIREIHQVGGKTCLIADEHIIVLDPKSKDLPKEYKIPSSCTDSLTWSDEVILLNCLNTRYEIFAFDLLSYTFSKVVEHVEALGKLKWGDDDILVTNNGTFDPRRTYFYKANDLSKLERIRNIPNLLGSYGGRGVISQDRSSFVMMSQSQQMIRTVSFKNEKVDISQIERPKLVGAFMYAARKEGYLCTEVNGNQFALLDTNFNITASAKPTSYLDRRIIVLPDQQHFLSEQTDSLSVVNFKEKSKPKAKDELETTLFKLPGKIRSYAIDADNAKLIACLETKDGTCNLHIFENFQPLLAHREKLRQEFDSTHSTIELSMYGNRNTNAPKDIIDIVAGYALKPRP
ncbi:MAG: hypothetical protein ACYCQI_15915 [Gammaproteobacteria bacterium]